MKLIDNLNWRYAVKRMTGEKVPAAKLEKILEATRLTASSVGLQPYKVIVVEMKTPGSSYNLPHSTSRKLLKLHTCWYLPPGKRSPQKILMITSIFMQQ